MGSIWWHIYFTYEKIQENQKYGESKNDKESEEEEEESRVQIQLNLGTEAHVKVVMHGCRLVLCRDNYIYVDLDPKAEREGGCGQLSLRPPLRKKKPLLITLYILG